MKKIVRIFSYALLPMAAALFSSCGEKVSPDPERFDRVFVLYSEAHNNLPKFLVPDIWGTRNDKGEIIEEGLVGKEPNPNIPLKGSRDVAIVVTQVAGTDAKGNYDYTIETPAYMIRIYRDGRDKTILDTLKTYPAGVEMTDKETIRDVFSYVKEKFPSDHYGALVTSHGTGWLPEDYYRTLEIRPSSVGVHYIGAGLSLEGHETELYDFAEAMPMKLDYLLLDACLMGGVETAYEFRNITKLIAFSGTEIMADGFNYANMLSRIFAPNGGTDVEGICRDYFGQYDGTGNGASISLVDCGKMERLAGVCKGIFEKYRTEMGNIDPDEVQELCGGDGYRMSRHFFYDLEDILAHAGLSQADKAEFDAALAECVLYKANTKTFLGTLKIRTWCGMSMYLPCYGEPELDEFYKKLAWNKATSLVK